MAAQEEALASLAAALESANGQIEWLHARLDDEVVARLEGAETRLDEALGRLAGVHPDDAARSRSLAEDALARADHALARAGDALARSEALGADGLARADHALARADDAVARAESLGADAVARSDHALARADDAVASAESRGADGLARSDHALARANDAVARAESLGTDAIARSDHALARSDDTRAHADAAAENAVARAESLGADALARADHALDRAGDSLARAESLGSDAVARADHALARADDAVVRTESLAADALARADYAVARAGDALARAHAAEVPGEYATEAVREALLPARIAALAAWLELRPPLEDLDVSIILPTRDRPTVLPRAVASVLEQLYDRWELIVVDDGDTDAVEDVLADAEDFRVSTVPGPRRGLSAARNVGLDAASGDVVCYLDDDNVMHPAWLQAVAHVFAARDDVDVIYGVTLAEHRIPDTLADEGWWPAFWQLPWSREALLRENVTDAGALAHRRKLAEARFGEAIHSGEDWDLLIRLTADRPALAVPAISHAYATGGDDHMSRALGHRAALDDVRRRHADE